MELRSEEEVCGKGRDCRGGGGGGGKFGTTCSRRRSDVACGGENKGWPATEKFLESHVRTVDADGKHGSFWRKT